MTDDQQIPIAPDAETQIRLLREQLDEARSWARHGYEIGQRSTLWSDHGVAPQWLTEGWPNHFNADATTKILTQLDELLLHYRRPPAGSDHCDLLDTAWGVIANAGMHNGGWDHEHPEWVDAAERWRDRWHELLKSHCAAGVGS
jgi:glutathione S-transferase